MALTDELAQQIDYFGRIADETRALLSRALDTINERDAQIAGLTASPITDDAAAVIVAAAIAYSNAALVCEREAEEADVSHAADVAEDAARSHLFALVRKLPREGRGR